MIEKIAPLTTHEITFKDQFNGHKIYLRIVDNCDCIHWYFQSDLNDWNAVKPEIKQTLEESFVTYIARAI